MTALLKVTLAATREGCGNNELLRKMIMAAEAGKPREDESARAKRIQNMVESMD